MRKGFIDYISSTGANLYHDLHFDLGLPLYRGTADVASGALDVKLREQGIIRVYDVLFPADVLFKTDEYVYRVMMADEFSGKRMGTGELHHKIGKYALETSRQTSALPGAAKRNPSILATAFEYDVPVYSPSPGDSTIGLNFSAIHTAFPEKGPQVDPSIDRGSGESGDPLRSPSPKRLDRPSTALREYRVLKLALSALAISK